MADTDSPLKRLVNYCIKDFAAWLLDAEVRDVHTLNIELTTEPTKVDQLFHVTLVNGRSTMLHIEFQGRSTHSPMRWRMLDYMARLTNAERDLDLYSVVFYVGKGVGAKDTGEHKVMSLDGTVSLLWQYRVIRLWEIRAEDLLALKRPGLLPLIGLTQIDTPAELMPQVVDELKTVSNPELQARLFTSLMALIDDDEVIKMIDKLVESDDLLMNTPFLRRIRKEGAIANLQDNILTAVMLRLDPPVSHYRKLETSVQAIDAADKLNALFEAVLRVQTVEEFEQVLNAPDVETDTTIISDN